VKGVERLKKCRFWFKSLQRDTGDIFKRRNHYRKRPLEAEWTGDLREGFFRAAREVYIGGGELKAEKTSRVLELSIPKVSNGWGASETENWKEERQLPKEFPSCKGFKSGRREARTIKNQADPTDRKSRLSKNWKGKKKGKVRLARRKKKTPEPAAGRSKCLEAGCWRGGKHLRDACPAHGGITMKRGAALKGDLPNGKLTLGQKKGKSGALRSQERGGTRKGFQ